MIAVFFELNIMKKEKIINQLKSIKYPGFSRDIVSFGMVKDVTIENDSVNIQLNISSQNDEKKQLIIAEINDVLSEQFKIVDVEIVNETPQKIVAPQSPTGDILSNVKHIIAVASGKGGVGKSTIAANLACAMSNKGFNVGLLDLDIYGPSLPIVLGINEQPKMTQNKKLVPLKKFGLEVMSFGFISGNDTPVIWRGPLVSRMTEQFFRDVEWGKLDVMILDLPPGTGDIQLTLTQKLKMSGAVIITTPQDIALSDVQKGADMFLKVNTPVLGVVENLSGLVLEGSVTGDASSININNQNIKLGQDGEFNLTLDLFKSGGGLKESERLGVPLLGKIPIISDIMSSTDSGLPIVWDQPDSYAGKIYNKISDKLISQIPNFKKDK